MGSKDIDHDRRRFVEGAAVSVAAAAALSMLPEDAAAVTTGNGAIRRTRHQFSGGATRRPSQANQRDKMA